MNAISKIDFDALYEPDIKKREYEAIISLIDDRFNEIVEKLIPGCRSGRNWYAYGNCDYSEESSCGFFDAIEHKEEIYIGGEHSYLEEPYGTSFPTRWLWEEDFEQEYLEAVKKCKDKFSENKAIKKQKRIDLLAKKLQFRKLIEQKLTKEELKYIEFK